MHAIGVGTLDEIGRPAVALEQRLELFMRDSREQRRVVDLVAVQMEDRQHRAVAERAQKLVRMPRRGERPRLGLAIPDHDCHEQIRIVERRAERV